MRQYNETIFLSKMVDDISTNLEMPQSNFKDYIFTLNFLKFCAHIFSLL